MKSRKVKLVMKFKNKKTNDIINYTSPDFIEHAKKNKDLELLEKKEKDQTSNKDNNTNK